MKNYYKILGVSCDASGEEIKRAFFRLAQKHHPDKGGNSEKFKEINEAYQVLGDREKRAQYDRFGYVFEGAPSGAEGFNQGPSASQNFDFSFFSGDFDTSIFEDIFEEFFGSSPFRTWKIKRKTRGKDILLNIDISLEEAFFGVKREIILEKDITCSSCNGSGAESESKIITCPSCRGTGKVKKIHQTFFGSFAKSTICPQCQGGGRIPEKKCKKCNGEGRVKGKKKVIVSIPAGIQNRERIKITGEGEVGGRGRKPGDLYIKVYIIEHPYFKRRGDDIYFDLEVKFSQATLGDKVDVPTLAGKVELQIPPGTQAGKLLRLKGMGMSHLGERGKGDMYVKINVKTPKRLTKKQRELIEKLKKEGI